MVDLVTATKPTQEQKKRRDVRADHRAATRPREATVAPAPVVGARPRPALAARLHVAHEAPGEDESLTGRELHAETRSTSSRAPATRSHARAKKFGVSPMTMTRFLLLRARLARLEGEQVVVPVAVAREAVRDRLHPSRLRLDGFKRAGSPVAATRRRGFVLLVHDGAPSRICSHFDSSHGIARTTWMRSML